jgi:cysteine synthase B
MQARGEGLVLDQFANHDNPIAHYETTGPEIWRQTEGKITHFVSSMGTTGTIMGVSAFLKEQNPDIQIIGLQPIDGATIPGIRRWPEAYMPSIFDRAKVDRIMDISQQESEETMRALASKEGIFCGVSAGGAVAASLRLSKEVENAIIVSIICDRGDRYLSTGVFS